MTDPIQTLWTSEGGDAHPPAPAELRRRARALNRRTWLRDAIEYTAALIGIGAFVHYWLNAANMVVATGCALVVLGTLIVVAGLWHRRARAAPDAAAEASVAYLRGQMARQRDMLAGVWRWYLAPVVPGLLVFLFGVWLDLHRRAVPGATPLSLLTLALVAAVFTGVWWLNRRAARRFDDEIAALDGAISEP